MDSTMDTLVIQIQSSSKSATESINTLVDSLKRLRTELKNVVDESKNLSSLKVNLPSVGVRSSLQKKATVQPMSREDALAKINVSGDLTPLNTLKKSDGTQLQKYRDTMGSLVTVTKKAKNGVDSFTASVKANNPHVKTFSEKIENLKNVFSSAQVKMAGFITGFVTLANKVGDFVNQAGAEQEALNLFTVTMGKYAKQGVDWIEKFSEALYLDPVSVMQYMGSFNSLVKGLGVGSENAYKMSKNLTQLVYDFSSFKNISIESAYEKLMSGIAGELEPIRNQGVAMSEATLQTLAYSLGIDKLVRNMTEAEKAQLRYIQIMRSTSEWQTDMGRTLVTPANALRVMKQQFIQLGRAIGKIFIPIIMEVMPYVIAITQLLTALANKIAKFLGYEIADIDYSNLGEISSGITDIGTSADKTTEKLNTMLAPFDDLNVVQTESKSGGSGSGLGGVGGDLGVPLPEYDALANLNEKFAKGVERAKKNIESMLPIIIAIGGALATWKIAKSVIDFMSWWDNLSKAQKTIARITLGVIATVVGTTLKFSGDEDVRNEETLMQGIAKQLGGAILTGVGVGLITKNVFIGIAIAGMSLSNSGVITMSHGDEEQFHTGLAQALGGTATTFGATFGMTKSVTISLIVTGISAWMNVGKAIQELRDLEPTWEELCNASAEVIGNSFIGELSNYITEGSTNLVTGLWEGMSKASDSITDFFTDLALDVGKGVVEISNGITDGLTDFFIDLGNTIGDGVYDAWESATDFWDKNIAPVFTKEWWKTHVVDKVSGAFKDIKTETSKKWDETWVNIGNTLDTGKTTLSNKFTQIKEDIPKKWSETWTNVKDTAKTKWTDTKTWLSNNIGNKETWKNRFKGILDGASNILSELKKKFENWSAKIKTPNIYWSTKDAYKTSGIVKKALEALNLPTSIPKLKVKWYEQGGYPTSGDLFFANENGVPEMVGQIGNQTAVANNDQITTSITNALISALNQYDFGGGKAPTTIYIGNRKVYEGYGDYMAEENDRYGTNMIKI